MVDANGNGQLSWREVRRALNQMGAPRELRRLIRRNWRQITGGHPRDTPINLEQFTQLYAQVTAALHQQVQSLGEEQVYEIFDELDQDDDGLVSWPELQQVLTHHNAPQQFVEFVNQEYHQVVGTASNGASQEQLIQVFQQVAQQMSEHAANAAGTAAGTAA